MVPHKVLKNLLSLQLTGFERPAFKTATTVARESNQILTTACPS
jgi:hypothetical protein